MYGVKVVIGHLVFGVLLASAFEAGVDGDNYIIGGRPANRYQFPWLISLRNPQNHHVCGGFIMSDRWIGSAAQCTQGRYSNPNGLIAVSGAHTRTDGNRHRVARIINHPRYNNRFRMFDVSIIQTAERMPITPQGPIRAIRFPRGPVVHDFTTVFIAGWGVSRPVGGGGSPFPNVLQYKATRTITRQRCQEKHGPRAPMIHADNVCTINPASKGACTGDTGGPLVDQEGTCIGILSWYLNCASGYPDVYTQLWTAIPFFRQASQNTIPNLPQGQ